MPNNKLYISKYLILIPLILVIIGCRPPQEASHIQIWDVWNAIKKTYINIDLVNEEEPAGAAIHAMLNQAKISSYPFLLRLNEIAGYPPRYVPKELTDVWKTWQLLLNDFPQMDQEVLADRAVTGLADSFNDHNIVYLTADQYKFARSELGGTYDGIGATIGELDRQTVVVSIFPGGPAEAAHLQTGDKILAVDGIPTQNKGVIEVTEMIRGASGTWITLRIERPAEEPADMRLYRDTIEIPSVQISLLPGGIAYLSISTFRETTGTEFIRQLERLQTTEPLALILDLRNNPGGSLDAARLVADEFLAQGLIIYQAEDLKQRTEHRAEKLGLMQDIPVAAIVNKFTTDAAELVAAALQEHGRAKIFGTKTLGKGTGNNFQQLKNGAALYLPTLNWFTPSGKTIDGIGIIPDKINGQPDATVAQNRDIHLQRAYEYLDGQLPAFR